MAGKDKSPKRRRKKTLQEKLLLFKLWVGGKLLDFIIKREKMIKL